MPSVSATTWGYTLNNYSEAELVLVRAATTVDPIVEHVYTPEKGEGGTPHIQGFLRCARQVRLTYLKKHWQPRANFTALSSDEYRANMRAYVQKQDHTATAGTHQQRRAEPMLYPALIPELIVKWIKENTEEHHDEWELWRTTRLTWRWCKDLLGHQKETLMQHAHQVKELRYDETTHEWCWKQQPLPNGLGSHEAPVELLVELAKRELVKQHRVEAMIDRPEVMKAVRSYFHEILARMEHNSENGLPEETDDHTTEADDHETPGQPPADPP